MPNTTRSDDPISGKKIILGVTGGIAAYKSAYIASDLVRRGADVYVVMTRHAAEFIGKATFWGITSNDVITDIFAPPKPQSSGVAHVSLSEGADLMIIAPATADIIGKLANGIADDMLSTMAMVARRIVICPAMNVRMYRSPAVAANIERLRAFGHIIVDPESGRLACGDEGVGRLADPDKIVRVAEELLASTVGDAKMDYAGKRVLVSAGPTREPIDPIRFLSNRSSGKMGYAIAAEAVARGAKVTLVSGPTELDAPAGVEIVRVETVREMYDVITSRARQADVFVSASAPADFRPAEMRGNKIKKTEHFTLDLDKTEDILADVGASKGRTVLVGFAAETNDLERYAQGKLETKNLDLIAANNVGAGSDVFGSDANQVMLISRNGEKIALPRMPKRDVAKAILDYVKDNFLEDEK